MTEQEAKQEYELALREFEQKHKIYMNTNVFGANAETIREEMNKAGIRTQQKRKQWEKVKARK